MATAPKRRLPKRRALIAATLFLFACPTSGIDRAKRLEKDGELEEAAKVYVEVAKGEPQNLAAWDGAIELWCKKLVNVGECMGVLDLELDRLGNLTRHKDALAEVLERRARARIDQGLVDAAISDLDRALKASPDRPALYVLKAKANAMLGDRAEAIELLIRAKRLDPANQEADEVAKMLPAETGTSAPAAEPPFGGQ